MKKVMAAVLLLALSGISAHAAQNAVSVEVPVSCEMEGLDGVYIAKMETLNGTLLETVKQGLIHFKSTGGGSFVMEYTEPGNYHYRVLQDGEESSDQNFDSTAYAVDVYVSRKSDGTLVAEPVVYREGGSEKVTAVRFLNMPTEYYEESESEPETEEAHTENETEEATEGSTGEIEEETEKEPGPGGGEKPDPGSDPGPGTIVPSVRTGDQTPLGLFGTLMALSLAAVLFLLFGTGKKEGKENADSEKK